VENKIMERLIGTFLDTSVYSDQTKMSYAYYLCRFADWLRCQSIEIDRLSADDLHRYLSSQGWSANSRRICGNAIKSFVRYTFGVSHACLACRLPVDQSKPGRSLDQEQVDQLLCHFDTTTALGWRNLSMMSIMIETGIRESEVCRLALNDLELGRRRFAVLAKGQKWRIGVFSEVSKRFLSVWLEARKDLVAQGVPFVFVSIGGKKPGHGMTPAGLRAVFRRIGLEAGIGPFSPHDLRRTMATLFTEQGCPTRLVQVLGGWEDIRMVERYTRTLRPQQVDIYSPLSGYALDDPDIDG
jgi:integrase/recombinase XerD